MEEVRRLLANGYSIADSFALTALNAHSNSTCPFVMVQAASLASCDWMLTKEHDFLSYRPAGNQYVVCTTWAPTRANV